MPCLVRASSARCWATVTALSIRMGSTSVAWYSDGIEFLIFS
jgi:hypothetical protein